MPPHKEYRFSVITFEHDRYRWGDSVMEFRKFLRNMGYELVVSNLNVFGRDFEDWWIDPIVVNKRCGNLLSSVISSSPHLTTYRL